MGIFGKKSDMDDDFDFDGAGMYDDAPRSMSASNLNRKRDSERDRERSERSDRERVRGVDGERSSRKRSSADSRRSKANAVPEQASYTIDDALALFRKIPNQESSIIQTIVQTLKSAQIDVNKVISDAVNRINKLNEENIKLETEIANLERHIAVRKQSVQENQKKIVETRSLHEQFTIAVGSSKNIAPTELSEHQKLSPNPAQFGQQQIMDSQLRHSQVGVRPLASDAPEEENFDPTLLQKESG